MTPVRPVLQTIVDEALAATGARTAWLVQRDGEQFVVAAMANDGLDQQGSIGDAVQLVGARGYTLAAGQPAALMPSPDDSSNEGIGGYCGVPPSLAIADAGEGAVLLEVAAKRDGSGFSFDDIEALASLAQVASAAVSEVRDARDDVPTPARLGAELRDLEARDQHRYREVAMLVRGLLGTTS